MSHTCTESESQEKSQFAFIYKLLQCRQLKIKELLQELTSKLIIIKLLYDCYTIVEKGSYQAKVQQLIKQMQKNDNFSEEVGIVFYIKFTGFTQCMNAV